MWQMRYKILMVVISKGLENLVKNWKLGKLYKTTNTEADIKIGLALLDHVNGSQNGG
jgi:hypothetical protein